MVENGLNKNKNKYRNAPRNQGDAMMSKLE